MTQTVTLKPLNGWRHFELALTEFGGDYNDTSFYIIDILPY